MPNILYYNIIFACNFLRGKTLNNFIHDSYISFPRSGATALFSVCASILTADEKNDAAAKYFFSAKLINMMNDWLDRCATVEANDLSPSDCVFGSVYQQLTHGYNVRYDWPNSDTGFMGLAIASALESDRNQKKGLSEQFRQLRNQEKLTLTEQNLQQIAQDKLLAIRSAIVNLAFTKDRQELANKQDAYGLTPLHLAAILGDILTVNLILPNGADPKKVSSDGKQAIELAAMFGHWNVVEALIPGTFQNGGIDNNAYHQVLFHALSDRRPENVEVVGRVKNRLLQIRTKPIKDYKGSMEYWVDGRKGYQEWRLLNSAIISSNWEQFTQLLEIGADANELNRFLNRDRVQERTAVQHAVDLSRWQYAFHLMQRPEVVAKKDNVVYVFNAAMQAVSRDNALDQNNHLHQVLLDMIVNPAALKQIKQEVEQQKANHQLPNCLQRLFNNYEILFQNIRYRNGAPDIHQICEICNKNADIAQEIRQYQPRDAPPSYFDATQPGFGAGLAASAGAGPISDHHDILPPTYGDVVRQAGSAAGVAGAGIFSEQVRRGGAGLSAGAGPASGFVEHKFPFAFH
jgi:ankyrin repeat protein